MRGVAAFVIVGGFLSGVSVARATYTPGKGVPTWRVVEVVADGSPVTAAANTLYLDTDGSTDTVIMLPAAAASIGRQVAFGSARHRNLCPYVTIAPAAGDRIEDWDADRHAILFVSEGAAFRLVATAAGWQCASGCEWLNIDPRSVGGLKGWYDISCDATVYGGNGGANVKTVMVLKDLSWSGWGDISGPVNLSPPGWAYDGVSRPAAAQTYDRLHYRTAAAHQPDGASGMAVLVVGRLSNVYNTSNYNTLVAWDSFSGNTKGFRFGLDPVASPSRLRFCAGPNIIGSACAYGHVEKVSKHRLGQASATQGVADLSLYSVRAVGTFGIRVNGSDSNAQTSVTWANLPFAAYTYAPYAYPTYGASTGGQPAGVAISSFMLYDRGISENDFKALERMLMRRYGLAR